LENKLKKSKHYRCMPTSKTEGYAPNNKNQTSYTRLQKSGNSEDHREL
jgi:hypothetical protein